MKIRDGLISFLKQIDAPDEEVKRLEEKVKFC